MFCIACCDDDPACRERLARQLEKILRARGAAYRIYTFTNGAALLRALADPNTAMDLLFLDIMLAGESGLSLAAQLRQLRPALPVVLVSVSPEFALDSFAVHPAHYLLKPISDEALAETLDYCAALLHAPEPLVFRWNHSEKVLPIAEVQYIEVLDSQVKLHTRSGGEYQFRGCLSSIEDQLPAGQFVRCHKSFLVNLDCVQYIRRYVVVVTGGLHVPISKQKYASVKEAYTRYYSRRLFQPPQSAPPPSVHTHLNKSKENLHEHSEET